MLLCAGFTSEFLTLDGHLLRVLRAEAEANDDAAKLKLIDR